MRNKFSTTCIFGAIFDTLTIDEVIARIQQSALKNSSLFISTVNLNYLRTSYSNQAFKKTLFRSDICTIDGGPIAFLLRLYGEKKSRRVTGADLLDTIIRTNLCIGRPFRVYIFGGANNSANLAKDEINSIGSFVKCVGAKNPGHGSISEMSTAEIIAEINEAKPDLLVVSLGAEKGQLWIDRNITSITPCTVSHLGAAINFVSGAILRAPKHYQELGMEWAWRIKQEPKLFQRYFLDAKHLVFKLVPMLVRVIFSEQALKYIRSNEACADPQINFRTSLNKAFVSGDWTKYTVTNQTRLPELPNDIKVDIIFDDLGKIDGQGLGILLRWCTRGNAVLQATNPKQINQKLKPYGIFDLITKSREN